MWRGEHLPPSHGVWWRSFSRCATTLINYREWEREMKVCFSFSCYRTNFSLLWGGAVVPNPRQEILLTSLMSLCQNIFDVIAMARRYGERGEGWQVRSAVDGIFWKFLTVSGAQSTLLGREKRGIRKLERKANDRPNKWNVCFFPISERAPVKGNLFWMNLLFSCVDWRSLRCVSDEREFIVVCCRFI